MVHGASSGFGYRRQPPDIKSNCMYVEKAVVDSQQRVNISCKTLSYYRILHKGSDLDGFLWITQVMLKKLGTPWNRW
jgi:hypothetical protein